MILKIKLIYVLQFISLGFCRENCWNATNIEKYDGLISKTHSGEKCENWSHMIAKGSVQNWNSSLLRNISHKKAVRQK